MKTIKGDLIALAKTGEFDVIAHGCNCFCNMGAGIAKSIKAAFPLVALDDSNTIKGDNLKLGTIRSVGVTRKTSQFVVVNAYTQYRYGRGLHADYEAIRSCMKYLKEQYSGKRIGLPLIGCGLAGGDWNIVSKIIEEELGDEDVTIVEYQKG